MQTENDMLIVFACTDFTSTWQEDSMRQFLEEIGANRVVLALSAARMGDAVGNSILFIVIPLYIAELPSPWFPLPETVRAGLLISLYGLVNALLQPFVIAGAMLLASAWIIHRYVPETVTRSAQ
jgi:hypothetical protein